MLPFEDALLGRELPKSSVRPSVPCQVTGSRQAVGKSAAQRQGTGSDTAHQICVRLVASYTHVDSPGLHLTVPMRGFDTMFERRLVSVRDEGEVLLARPSERRRKPVQKSGLRKSEEKEKSHTGNKDPFISSRLSLTCRGQPLARLFFNLGEFFQFFLLRQSCNSLQQPSNSVSRGSTTSHSIPISSHTSAAISSARSACWLCIHRPADRLSSVLVRHGVALL